MIGSQNVGHQVLVADIGGTNARFAIARSLADGRIALADMQVFRAEDFESIRDAVDAYLEGLGGPQIEEACFAIACPVTGEVLAFTNSHWTLDAPALARDLSLQRFLVINDFVALSYGTTQLRAEDVRAVKQGVADPAGPVAVIGPGTGLGQATLLPMQPLPLVLSGQGGHSLFAPMTETEINVLQFIQREHGAVTYERLLSGRGLVNIHRALCVMADQPRVALRPDEISEAALTGEFPVAAQAVDMFCAVLGSFACGVALTVMATGGVRLGGGILPKIADVFVTSRFVERFCASDQMAELLESIPVDLILRGDVALLGAARWIADNREERGYGAH